MAHFRRHGYRGRPHQIKGFPDTANTPNLYANYGASNRVKLKKVSKKRSSTPPFDLFARLGKAVLLDGKLILGQGPVFLWRTSKDGNWVPGTC